MWIWEKGWDKGGPANMAEYRNYIWSAHFINHYHPNNPYTGDKDNEKFSTWYLITLNIDSLQILIILDVMWHCLFTNSVHYVGISNKQFGNANIQCNFWNIIGQTMMEEMALLIPNIFRRKVGTLWCCCEVRAVASQGWAWHSVLVGDVEKQWKEGMLQFKMQMPWDKILLCGGRST
jgi:hypothetical protein